MSTNRFLYPLIVITVMVITACAPTITQSSASFQQWHTANVLQVFQDAGLPIEIPQLSKDERDMFSTSMAVESKSFIIPSQGDPTLARGMIFSFQREEDLKTIQDYYQSLGKSLPQYSSWIFVKDNVLLQINGNVPEDVANLYAKALNLLDGG